MADRRRRTASQENAECEKYFIPTSTQQSIHEEIQRTSRYLEHQRQRLRTLKNDIERRVKKQLGRSAEHLRDVQTMAHKPQSWYHSYDAKGRYPYRSVSSAARQRMLLCSACDQKSKSQSSVLSPLKTNCKDCLIYQPTDKGNSQTLATLPAHLGKLRNSTAKGAINMSLPSNSSSSSPIIHRGLPLSLELNGGCYQNGNGTHHQNGDGIESRVSLSPDATSSVEQTVTDCAQRSYSKIRHRYRSPMTRDGLSPRSNDSSSSSALNESTNGHEFTKLEQNKDISFDLDGQIASGTLSALLKRLMPSKDYYPGRTFIFTMLLSGRLFISPLDILHEIVQHCIFEQNAKGDNFRKESRSKFFQNVLNLMSEWTETFPYDFRLEKMKERLKLLLELCCSSTDGSMRGYKSVLLQNVASKVSKLERYEKALNELQRDSNGCVHLSETFTGIAEKCSSPIIVAQQLTHIELERLSMIGPEEFIHAFSKECSSKDTTLFLLNHSNKGVKTGRNVEHYVDWCNQLSRLVATEICRHIKKKHRVRAIEFFIDVAKECFNMGNFNSLMAIVGGMDMSAVSRLKKTWAKVNVSKLAILERQLDPSGNFLTYRSTLKAAVWRSAGATKESERIIVPFFSLLWKDLLVSYEGCAKQLPNGHLNFAMFSQFASQMMEFMQWKQVECPFERNDILLRYILTSPTFTDKALQLASFEYEPPEQQVEKDLQKSLKSP